eukprot:scaffold17239_cov76-Phaeocystis_antarctica.AAC.2
MCFLLLLTSVPIPTACFIDVVQPRARPATSAPPRPRASALSPSALRLRPQRSASVLAPGRVDWELEALDVVVDAARAALVGVALVVVRRTGARELQQGGGWRVEAGGRRVEGGRPE